MGEVSQSVRSSFAKCDARVHDCVGLPPEVDNTLDTLPKVIMGELIFYAPIFLIPLFRSALAALYTSLKVELWALGTQLTGPLIGKHIGTFFCCYISHTELDG